jgi:DNA-binding transcriptional regulator YdaS (Cro superfamily)
MKPTALIERAGDGIFTIFTPDMESTIIGSGATVADAKSDFEVSVNAVLSYYNESGKQVPDELKEIEFEYKYDTASVFDELSCINISKFAEFAGIYPSTMRQYARGLTRVSEKQARKIEAALHSLGQKFQSVHI